MHQVAQIERIAELLGLGQGEVMQIAAELMGHEIASLYDLDRAQLTRILSHLDSLQLVGTA